jgi:hypothetical protein
MDQRGISRATSANWRNWQTNWIKALVMLLPIVVIVQHVAVLQAWRAIRPQLSRPAIAMMARKPRPKSFVEQDLCHAILSPRRLDDGLRPS